MPNILELIADQLPRVTVDDVRRFADTVEIRDAQAFAVELEVFMQERLERVSLPVALEVVPEAQALQQGLTRRAAALRAGSRWTPSDTDIQRGRAALETYDQPHNLPLPEFARLANKVRQQIYRTSTRAGC